MDNLRPLTNSFLKYETPIRSHQSNGFESNNGLSPAIIDGYNHENESINAAALQHVFDSMFPPKLESNLTILSGFKFIFNV